jgi:hypothetical protein
MMEYDDEKMMYAMAALIGLVIRGESPSSAAEQMWTYANFAINYKAIQHEPR